MKLRNFRSVVSVAISDEHKTPRPPAPLAQCSTVPPGKCPPQRISSHQAEAAGSLHLRWRGIEATLQLAQSSNSKVVIIGSAKDGLPVILGNSDTPPPGQTSPDDRAAKETTAVPNEKLTTAGSGTAEAATPDHLSLSDIEASRGRREQ